MKKRREYLQCPMCGWIRPRIYSREVRFDKVDTTKVMVWQMKEMGGYKSGFKLVDHKTMKDLPNNLKDQIRTQAERILEELK